MQTATVRREPSPRRNHRHHEPKPVSKGRRDRSRGWMERVMGLWGGREAFTAIVMSEEVAMSIRK
eukprot:2498026-Prymnesium_polylepis.1